MHEEEQSLHCACLCVSCISTHLTGHGRRQAASHKAKLRIKQWETDFDPLVDKTTKSCCERAAGRNEGGAPRMINPP